MLIPNISAVLPAASVTRCGTASRSCCPKKLRMKSRLCPVSKADFSDNLFVHVPFDWFEHYRETFRKWNVFPEFLISAGLMDKVEEGKLISLARDFRFNRIRCTVHAPFIDMDLGSSDDLLVFRVRSRLMKILDIADILRPDSIVIHPGYDPNRDKDDFKTWWNTAFETIDQVASAAQRFELNLAFENVNDTTPVFLKKVVDHFARYDVGVCLDIGHLNVFSRVSTRQWIETLGRAIRHVHLHDNAGESDDHLALGEGAIDFAEFLAALEEHNISPCYTIENTSTEDVESSLSYLRSASRER